MRITVQTKMLTAFAMVLVLMGIVGWLGITNLGTMSGLAAAIHDDNLESVKLISSTVERLHRMRVGVLSHLVAGNDNERKTAEGQIADHEKAMLATIDQYSKMNLTQQEKDLLAKFNSGWSAYKTLRDKIIDLSRQGKDQETMQIFDGPASEQMNVMQDSLDSLLKYNIQEADKANKEAKATYENIRMVMLGLLALAVLLGFAVTLFLSRSIARGVGAMAKAAGGLASGDVDQKVEVKGSDEIGQMADSFRKMIGYVQDMAGVAEAISRGDLSQRVEPRSDRDALGTAFERMVSNLRQMIGSVSSSALSLTDSSRQLSAASEQAGAATSQIATTIQQVARGNQEQSAAVQETSASVNQLSRAIDQIAGGAQEQAKSIERASASVSRLNSSVSQVASSSREVNSAAEQAHQAASTGGEAVKKTTQGMVAIKDSTKIVDAKIRELESYSKQIGSIVDAIDDIAGQTNLLALNAAIEAARAGEHGRGFAVVADEVRKLAERAGRSTKEITNLIAQVQKGTQEAVSAMEQGAKEVESGFKLAEEAGDALKNIISAVKAAADQAAHIASAVQQMEQASQEVINVMDSVSAVIEESTAATEEMAASSQQVNGAIEKVAAVSEETSAAAEEVSASTEEMSAQVEEVVALSQSLAQMAEQLQEAVTQFKVGEEAEVVMQRHKEDWEPAIAVQTPKPGSRSIRVA